MADKIGDDATFPQKRFEDQGDNTFAEVVTLSKKITGGDLGHRLASSAASTNATRVLATANTVTQVKAENTSGADIFVLLFDSADNPPVLSGGGATPVRKRLKFKAGQIMAYDGMWGMAAGLGYAIVAADGASAVAGGALIDLEIDFRS